MINRIKRIFGFDKDQQEDPKLDFPQLREIEENAFVKEVRERVLKYVPLQNGDCLSCKLLGTGFSIGVSISIMNTTCKLTPKQSTVTSKVSVIVLGTSASLVFAVLAYIRFFDKDFFTGKKPLKEMLEDEKKMLKKLIKKE